MHLLTSETKEILKRHEGLITVASVIIVTASFWVKDNVREKYKDWASSIDHAQMAFDLATQNTTISHKLDSQFQAFCTINNKVNRLNPKWPPREALSKQDLHDAVDALDQQQDLEDVSLALDILKKFIKKLPERREEEKQLQHLETDLKAMKMWIK